MQRSSSTGSLLFIFFTVLIDVIGLGIIIPIFPKMITTLSGQDLSNAAMIGGWLMFTYAIMQFIFSPILGGLSDQFGRRPVLLISLFGLGVDYLVTAFAPTLFWLFLSRIFAGIAGSSYTTATAYIADISSPEKRAQNFGMIGVAFGLGFIIGPVIGGTLGQYGYKVPFLVSAGLAFINMIYGYFVLPESLSKENRRKFDIKRANPVGALIQLRKYPLIIGLAISFFLLYIAGHANQSTWTFITMEKFEWDEAMVGYSLGVIGFLVALVQGGLIRVVIPYFGEKKSIYIGLAFYILGFGLYSLASEGWMLFLFMIPFCLGGIAGPTIQGLISNQVPDNEQGELQGALTSLISITSIIGPLIMTGLFYYFTSEDSSIYLPTSPFIMAGLLTLLSLIIVHRSFKYMKSNTFS